jgi:two-component system sensor histidine kinase UhpB
MSSVTHCNSAPAQRRTYFPWRDAAVVAAVTLFAAALFAWIDLSETLFAFTRGWEHLQIDELPITLLVLAAGLAWFSWRRYREMRAELTAREAAESRLALLLQDHRRLTQQYVELQESERKALARELHDELGQYLTAIKTDAVSIQMRAAPDEPVHRAASAVIDHCDHLHETVRNMIGQLRPVGLDILGLRAAIEHYVDVVRQSTPQRQLRLRIEGEIDDLGDVASLTLYRLIQEGLTNVSRHAGARSVDITIARRRVDAEDTVTITLSDDGRGADPKAKTLGLGLLGMRERVEMLDGTFEIRTAPGKGFAIHARIPVAGSPAPTQMGRAHDIDVATSHQIEHMYER